MDLIQIVDAALAEAARKAGPWLVCKPGCAECCTGSFEISHEDVDRLRFGLAQLEPAHAARIVQRAAHFVELEEELADETPCPALDPETQTCELYQWRPLTCRLFGPPVRGASGAIGICELCFHGASEEEIAACELKIDPGLLNDEDAGGSVAQALL